MSYSSKFFNLSLFNAGSLSTGHDDFLLAMARHKPDVVAINETWLAAGQEARAPTVPGYRLRCTPRPMHMRGGRGGGVAFYIKQDLRVRYEKYPIADIEQMWISTKLNGRRTIIGTAYRPQWVNVDKFIDAITQSVTHFSDFDQIVLLGDFNINMLDKSKCDTIKFQQFLTYMDLVQVVTEPTHFTSDSATLIDVVCTNAPVREVSVLSIRGDIGHAMVNVTLLIKKLKFPAKCLSYRPLKHIDLHAFNNDLNSLDWESILTMPTIDEKVDGFNCLMLSLFDRHAPTKTVKLKYDHTLPWITDTIRYMTDLRNDAYKKYRLTKSDVDKKTWKDLKSLVQKSINNEKIAYFNHYVNSKIKDSKTFWKNIKTKILVDPSQNDKLPECFNDPNIINDHFITLPTSNDVSFAELSYYNTHRFKNASFDLKPICENDIYNFIIKITSNAVGSDGVSRDMVILTLPRTLKVITDLINESIIACMVPRQWKVALVTPLPKGQNPTQLKDLRPISILPFLSKILEKAVYSQLSRYVEDNNILPSYQSGFRRGRGTCTALLNVVDDILAEQDAGRGTVLALLDFSRAFDSISIPLLLSKLRYYGLQDTSVSWFENYLNDRLQSVKLANGRDGGNILSDFKPLTRGVPQGSILGPLLFVLYCADIVSVIKHCKFHCYADDIQLYISDIPKCTSDAVYKLNEDLGRVADWSLRNCLLLNPLKSKFMIIGTKLQVSKILESNPVINIHGQTVERVDEARNLGIMFDSNLRFESHVLNLVKNCMYRLKVLYRVRNQLSEKARVTLCESLVLSRLNYGDIVFGPRLLSKSQRLLQRVQNACCRFCFTVPPRSRISPFLNAAGMLNMESRRQLHMSSLIFNLMKFNEPDYLFKKLKVSPFHDRYGTRSSRAPLAGHIHRSVAFRGSFRFQATKCWNDIPPPIRNLTVKSTFLNHLKLYLQQQQLKFQ